MSTQRRDRLALWWITIVGAVSLTAACALLRGHTELPAPCDTLTLAQLTRECRAAVHRDCKRDSDGIPDATCPTLRECDRRIDLWYDCPAVAPAVAP